MSTSMPRAPLPQAPFAPPPHPGAAPAPGRGAGKRLAAARLSRGALDLVIALVVLAGAALVPLFAPTFLIPPLELVLVYVIALASLVVLVGYCGQISLCQVSFMGLGAFLTAAFMGHYGWSFWVAAPAACLVVFGAGVAVGLPALRLRGLTLAIVTLSLALVADNFLFTDIGWLNNDTYGWRLTPPQLFGFKLTDQDVRFRVFLAVTALVLLAVTRLRVGRTGKSWYAMRDAEIAAATSGVPIVRMKLLAFGIAAALAALAGALYALHNASVNANSFMFIYSIQLLAIVVIAGVRSLRGAVLGALFYVLVPLALNNVAALQGLTQLILGGGLILQMLFAPQGIGGLLDDAEGRLFRRLLGARDVEDPHRSPAAHPARVAAGPAWPAPKEDDDATL